MPKYSLHYIARALLNSRIPNSQYRTIPRTTNTKLTVTMSGQQQNSAYPNLCPEHTELAKRVQFSNVNPYMTHHPYSQGYPISSTAHPPPPQQIESEKQFGDFSAHHQTRNNYATSSSVSPWTPYAKGDGQRKDPWMGAPAPSKDEAKK